MPSYAALYDLYLPPTFECWAIATQLEGDEAMALVNNPSLTLSLGSQSRIHVYQIVTTIKVLRL